MSAFRFQDPIWLWLLLPVIGLGLLSIRRERRTAVLYSNVELLRGLPVTFAQRLKRCLPWLRIGGMVLIVFALARPQSGREEFRIRTEGIAIEMCIDRSGSMQALDFPIDGSRLNRLDAVKRVFRQFVAGEGGFDGRPDDLDRAGGVRRFCRREVSTDARSWSAARSARHGEDCRADD